jgi:D-glycero-D-manno-heptose 1,7-bisphosphate phosphatase
MKYVFLDRDGTLIRHVPYLSDPAFVELLPTVAEGLAVLLQSGCKLFLHTNQSGVGRGYFALDDALSCNEEMLRQIGLGCDVFEAVCVCPELPGDSVVYRKPSSKFGLEVIEKYGISKNSICYVGDNVTDLLTARNLGCFGAGVSTGVHDLRFALEEHGLAADFPVFDSFLEAAVHIVNLDR